MSMYTSFQTDHNLERDGVWTEFGDFRVKIAYAGGANKAFTKMTEATFKPYIRQIQDKTIDKGLVDRLSKKVAAHTVVTDWEIAEVDENGEVIYNPVDNLPVWKKGIHAPDGSIWEVNPENVLKVFNLLPHLYEDILNISSEITAYRIADRETASGN